MLWGGWTCKKYSLELDKYDNKIINKNNKMGIFDFLKGNKLTDEMLSEGFTGKGKMTYPNGDKYVGEWKDAKKHGQGTYTFANGTILSGKWRKDKFKGKKSKYTT